MTKKFRLKELVYYICYRCKGSRKACAIKLNKILWFADSFVYRQTGKSITGCQYRKSLHGIVPFGITAILEELENEGKLNVLNHEYFGFSKRTFIASTHPPEDVFSKEELELVDLLTVAICDGHPMISDLSHDVVWEAASMGEEIPLTAVLATDEAALNEKDVAWANEIVYLMSCSDK